MRVDNALSKEFMLSYPVEAARVLEQVSNEHVVALFNALPAETTSLVMVHMLPKMAAACIEKMDDAATAKLLARLPVSAAVRIYRLLSTAEQEQVSSLLAEKARNRIRRHLVYPAESAGALLNPDIDVLPMTITVAEAMRRIDRLSRTPGCDIYLVDDEHHLVGVLELGKLLTSRQDARLQAIMNRKTQPIYTHATTSTLLAHPGWTVRRRLPVVERDNSLVGMMDYQQLREAVGETDFSGAQDPMQGLFALLGLYWLSMAQLIDSLLHISVPKENHDEY